MIRYDCTLEGIRTRAEHQRAKAKARDCEFTKYESIHKIPNENRNEIQTESGTGIEFTLLQEIIAAMVFCFSMYLYWFTN